MLSIHTIGPKLMFWCISFRLGAFGTISLLHKTCCKTRQTSAINAEVRAMMWCKNFSQQMLPIHTIGPLTHVFGAFLSVWVHLEPFCYYTKLAAKHAKLVELMQKFVAQCLVRFFRNERSQSAPLEPKLLFWCVSFRLGQLGAINAKVRATKSRQNFSKRTLPIHTIGP